MGETNIDKIIEFAKGKLIEVVKDVNIYAKNGHIKNNFISLGVSAAYVEMLSFLGIGGEITVEDAGEYCVKISYLEFGGEKIKFCDD